MTEYNGSLTRAIDDMPLFGVACYEGGEDFPNGERALLNVGLARDWESAQRWLAGASVELHDHYGVTRG